MRRTYKFLLRPTAKQAISLAACLEDHRQLYNAALEERRVAWAKCRTFVSYGDQSGQLKDIRRDDPDGQGRWAFSSQQATLRRLNRSYADFFRRLKAGQRAGYPRFKGAGWFDTVEWPKDRDGCRWNSTPESRQTRVRLQGVGHVRVHAHRDVTGRLKTITVRREGKRWFVALACDDVPARPLPPTGTVIGIDLGVASLLSTSDGVQVENPRHGHRAASQIGMAQRALARCKPRSNRRQKARARVASLYGKVRRQRLDHAHKTALWLVRHHDLIAHEDLRIANMTRSASGTVIAPGTKVAQKSGLNRAILDAGWGVFLQILAAKAESAGRTIVAVDPRNTSRTCPSCGHCCAENRVTQADFRCTECGFSAHADVVGATNILRAGLALRDATAN